MKKIKEIFQELKNYINKNTKVLGIMNSTITTNDIILVKDNMSLTITLDDDKIKCHEWNNKDIEDDNIWWFKENNDPMDMKLVADALFVSIDSYIL